MLPIVETVTQSAGQSGQTEIKVMTGPQQIWFLLTREQQQTTFLRIVLICRRLLDESSPNISHQQEGRDESS